MERSEVLQVVRDKAVDRFGVEPEDVREDRSFVDDLHVDSLALVEYVMDLEDAFGVELPEEEVERTSTVGALLDLVTTKLDTALNRDG